jgi:hypothetical protein
MIDAAFVITPMVIIAQRYNRRRRHIVDLNEELEWRVKREIKSQEIYTMVQISIIMTVCAYRRHPFMTYVLS